jgi:hypothetical protein
MKFRQHIFSKKHYRSAVIKASNEIRDAAAKEFIVTLLRIIPIWSGAAQATLIPLNTLLKDKAVININPTEAGRKSKQPQHGETAGKRHGKAELLKDPKNYLYGFTYSHNLFHKWLWEHFGSYTNSIGNSVSPGPGKKPAPWKTGPEARLAAIKKMRELTSTKFPKVSGSFTKRKLTQVK